MSHFWPRWLWSRWAPRIPARAAGQDNRWRIMHADYGYGNRRTDVTDLLRQLIARGGVNGRIAVNNQTMGGDPAVGADKSLQSLRGTSGTKNGSSITERADSSM